MGARSHVAVSLGGLALLGFTLSGCEPASNFERPISFSYQDDDSIWIGWCGDYALELEALYVWINEGDVSYPLIDGPVTGGLEFGDSIELDALPLAVRAEGWPNRLSESATKADVHIDGTTRNATTTVNLDQDGRGQHLWFHPHGPPTESVCPEP